MKIFISSTSYDLFDLRSYLVHLLEKDGHEVIYHESPTFPAKINLHSHDQCLEAIKEAELVICLIDKRYGGNYRGSLFNSEEIAVNVKLKDQNVSYKYKDLSITWMELLTADEEGIPIITFARSRTLDEKEVRRKNHHVIKFNPAYVEKIEIFDLLDWITKREINNWIVPFYNFIDFRAKIEICIQEFNKSIVVNSDAKEIKELSKILILVEGEQDRGFISNLIEKMDLEGDFLILPTYGKFAILKNYDGLIQENLSKFDHVLVLVDSDKINEVDINFKERFEKLTTNQEKVKLFFAIENIEAWADAGIDKNKLPLPMQLSLGNDNKRRKAIHNFVPNYFDPQLAINNSKDFEGFYSFLKQFAKDKFSQNATTTRQKCQ